MSLDLSSAAPGAPGAPTSAERIKWVVALDRDHVRRNLLITQCYHDLATALAGALGAENANWCTFATWASRTAGTFIREDEIPAPFRVLLGGSKTFDVSLAHVDNVLGRPEVAGHGLIAAVRGIVHNVAKLITSGNLAVFGELAPIFSSALDALAGDPGVTALDSLCGSLTPGPSDHGGQSMLRSALRQYALARAEGDAGRKAGLMLLANGQVGLHEQIRLQPFIAGSFDAPILDPLYDLEHAASEGLPRAVRHRVRVAINRLMLPLADAACRLWQRFATRELMTLSLPDGTLTLGKDLPAPPGAPLYPSVLDPIVVPEALQFLQRYDGDRPGAPGTGAVDWTQLSDRIPYILDLFRSRQVDRALQGEPFSADQLTAILDGRHWPASGPARSRARAS